MAAVSSLVLGTLQTVLSQDEVEALDAIIHYQLHVP